MDNTTIIAVTSIVISGLTLAIGVISPAASQGRALAAALSAIAQQPDESNTITRTLFVGMALIESFAIYTFLISLILIFFNPFWTQISGAGG
jgi:F-type H+-transporting ATPase subunit c